MNDASRRTRRPAHDPARAQPVRFERSQRIAAGRAPSADVGGDDDDEAGRALVATIAALDAQWTEERRVLFRPMRVGTVVASALLAAGIAALVLDVGAAASDSGWIDARFRTVFRVGEDLVLAALFILVGTGSVALQRVNDGYHRYREQRDRWVGWLIAHRAGDPVTDAPPDAPSARSSPANRPRSRPSRSGPAGHAR